MKTTYRAMKNGKMTNFTVPQDKIQEFLNKYPDATLVQSGTVSTGIGEKSIQTSKFENAPGLSEFPAVESKAFKEAKPKKVAEYFNRKLKDDGWDFEVDKEYLVAEAPNGESERFLLNAPEGFKVNEDGSISSAGMLSLPSSMKLSTQDDIREFINNNQLDLQGNIELDNKRYKVQKFLSDNFERAFEDLMKDEDLTNITQNAKSSIAELEEQDPQLLDEIRNRIVKRYEEKFGTTEGLTDYQIEDLFINVTNHLKNKQLRKSSHLVEEVKKNYEDGWAMNGTTVQDMIDQDESRLENEVLTSNEQSLRRKIKSHEQKLNYLKELESKEDFDENDPEYLHWKKAVEDDELYLKDELKKIHPEGGKFYVDWNSGEQIDQVYAGTSDDLEFEAYDMTDQVNQHIESILEANEDDDKATVKQKLTAAYEDDAFERSLFLNHIEGTTVNLKWHSGMSVNDYGEDKDNRMNYLAFRNQLKRLGYSYKSGEDVRDISVSDIIDNWNVFSKYLDGAYVDDGTARWNYLGDDIDQEDVGGYIKATKDMSIDMIARDRAWAQLHLLNIDPSSYKRSKKDLYLSSLVDALPFTDNYMLADAKERTADNFRGGAYSGDQRISNANVLIDEVNQELEEKGEAPIEISKAFSDKLELDGAERFWQGLGGFTPMLAEFAVVGGVAKGAMSLTGAASWLDRVRGGLYYSEKANKYFRTASVVDKAKKAKISVDAYAKGAGLVKSRFNSAWGNGLFHLSYGLLEEGKMQMLDPLFGTEMPLGSGLGFYFGGTAARWAMPFKFGHTTSKAWQRIGSAINPISEKVIKGGIGGAVAAEFALPMEQLLSGHKSWQRWKEETYPDLDVIQSRFVDNLALFGALGFTHMKWMDARFMVGKGRSSVEKWNKKADKFKEISEKGGEVDGKKYTAEEAQNEMFKYAELIGQAQSYIRASELIPQMQTPIGQKKMLDSQLEAIKQDAIKSTGKPAFEYEVTTDGKNFEGRKEPAYWVEIDGKSIIRIDARKVINGQIPHEVFHHVTMHHLAKGKKDGRVAAELAELSSRIKEYIRKAVKEATEGDLDFKKFVEKEYDGVWSNDAVGEIPAQLIELMASSRGYDLFISNNLISDIAFELSRWSEKIFTDAKGNTRGRWAGKLLQPKLDLSDPKTVIDYLARLSTGIKGGEYNINVINRLKRMFDDMKLADGKVIKNEKNGSETTVSTNSANIAEQIRLKDTLKPIIENYKKQIIELNNQRSKGDITNAKYNELRDKYLKEYQEKKETLSGNLIEIRDADDKDLRANSITEKNIQKEKATKLEGWKSQIDAKYDGKKYTDLYNKYIEEGRSKGLKDVDLKEFAERLVKEEWQGRDREAVASDIWNSSGLKNSINNQKTLLGSGSEGGKIIEDYQGQFHEDVMAEIQKRFSKHYNPGKVNEKYGRALTPWEWLTTGHKSNNSHLYRAVGDAAKKHGVKLPTVKVEATEGGWSAFEGHTASSGYMNSSKPLESVAEQTGIELSKTLEGMKKVVGTKKVNGEEVDITLGDIIDQKAGSDAKNLNWEATGAKEIVSYKNIAKNAKETIGKEVHLDYFGIEAEMYKKMGNDPARQLNDGDVTSIMRIIKGDIANHLAMLPLWKQHIIDRVTGENVAFEVVAGKFKSEPKATGVTTSVLKNPLLYREIPQTGTKGSKYEWSDRLKEYHKTENTEVKEAFEQDVVRSLTEGKSRAEISGILKGWMTQMEKALYVQGVNKALPNIPELTTRHKLIEMVNQISAGKSPELASQNIVAKLLRTMEAEGKNKYSDLLPILMRDEFKKEFDQKDIDKVYNAIELNKEEFISKEEAKANKAKERKIAESAKAASVKHIDKLEKENLESIVESLNELGFDVQVSDVKKANANSMQSAKWYSDKTVDWSDKPIKVIKRENIKAFQEWAGKFFRQLPREFGITFAKNMIGDPLQGRKNGFYEEVNGKLRLVRNTDPILDLNKIWEANIGKDVNPAFKGLTGKIASGSKIAKAYTKAREMAEAGDLQGGLDLLEKVVTKLDQAEKRGLYQALGRAQEAMLRSSKNKQEYIDGMTFVFDVAKNNANATEGERILTTFLSARLAVGESIGIENPIIKEFIDKGWVKDKANAYLKKNATDRKKNPNIELLTEAVATAKAEKDLLKKDRTKVEHYKSSLEASFDKAFSVIQLKWSTEGPALAEKYLGGYSTVGHFDIIDLKGLKTNPAGIARMAYHRKSLKDTWIYNYETGKFTGKNMEDLLIEKSLKQLRDFGVKVKEGELKQDYITEAVNKFLIESSPGMAELVSQTIKNKKNIERKNKADKKILKKVGLEGLRSSDIAGTLKNIDKAMELARKKNKKAKGISVYDFDDTLARTKSGIRYTIPNPSGKPSPGRKVILLTGSAGAGKTTIIDGLGLRGQGFKYVNQDIALDWLTKNSGMPKDMNEFTREQSDKWRELQYDAGYAAKRKAMRLQGNGDGVVIDGTGANKIGMERNVREFKQAGYDIKIVHVDSSLETALARNRSRSERRLTDTTVKNTWEAVQANKKRFRELGVEIIEVNTDNIKQGSLPPEFVSKMNEFVSGYTKGRLTAEEFALRGSELLEQGAEYDFSEFNKVVEGTPGPLFPHAVKKAKKYGTKDMFVLTARPQESAGPIYQFLKSQGLEIPLENITGLANSTGEAKAMWMLEKFAEGYNDFYFVDDALPNVRAVSDAMSRLDVKSKTRLVKQNNIETKDVKYSETLEWKTDKAGNIKTTFDIAGKKYNFNLDARDSQGSFTVEFNLGGRIDATGTGNSVRVFRTVYNGLIDLIGKNKKIKKIEFSARKGELSRVRLYTTLMDRLGKKLGWETDVWETTSILDKDGGHFDFELIKPRKKQTAAVEKVLDQLDIKSKVQQDLASQNISAELNRMLEYSLDVKAEKTFSKAEAKVRGGDIKRRRIFMTDSAADLELLLEPLYGKGKEGVENKKWFSDNFVKHFERGYNDINNAKQKAANEYMALRKQNKAIVKSLDKEVAGTGFTADMAVRVYLWNKSGIKIPDLAKGTEKKLVDHVKSDPKLQAFAENAGRIAKIKDPSSLWWAETIASEISDLGLGVSRSKFLADWIDAKNEIFSEENLNKMESKLGSNWRRNVEEMFDRMETGQTRSTDLGTAGNKIMDYLNGSVGSIMFLNTRSGTLQLISSVNFINHGFNNPIAAARAFANQPQYWKDFLEIINSDMLVQRRAGLKINVTEAELAAAAAGSKNPAKAVIAKILKAGYIPTKICDSFAIASGGATYYRNAIRKYMKEGMSEAEAKKKAWIEFQAIAERTQQSSRPDLLSAQQVSWGGRIVLPFANTPMQMNRIMMKELLDIKNGRYKGYFGDGSLTNKMSKVGYYGFVQSAIFAGLQSGLFALMMSGDEDLDELKAKKEVEMINTMADSFLRGMGIPGAVLAGLKNAILEFQKQNEKGFGADYDEVGEDLLNISPTIGSKFSKFDAAGNTYMYNKKEILEEGLTLDGPALEGLTMATEALFNIPVNRVQRKITNIQAALDEKNAAWQRIHAGLGWSKWGLGIGQREKAEEQAREKAEKEANEVQCSHIKPSGQRCSIQVKSKAKNAKCHYHKSYKPGASSDRDNDGVKEYQCTSLTRSGNKCKNRTENKNKKCYAHQ